MTKQEMLALVEAQIRKDIPRLMELREGCIIELDNVQAKISLSNYEFENSCTHLLRNKERLWYATDEDLKHSKIIGHDIMLNDVLEWLSYLGFLTECSNIDFGGDTFCRSELVYDDDDNFLYKKTTFCEWKLSSPYLKDQSEELIKFLYNIAKDE